MHEISQAFPFRFYILQVVKYWRQEWPENEVRFSQD